MMCVGNDDRPATRGGVWPRCAGCWPKALEQGAVGMSSGLTYVPGMYADTAELVDLCRVVARYGGYYSPHHRSYGAGALDAYDGDDRGRRGVRLPGAPDPRHDELPASTPAGRPQLIELIDARRRPGRRRDPGQLPVPAGCDHARRAAAELGGGRRRGRARRPGCAIRPTRHRIAADLEVTGSDGCHGVPIDWSTHPDQRQPAAAPIVGLSVAEAAARAGRTPRGLLLRSAPRRRPRHLLPDARRRTRRTCARSCGTRPTSSAATASWSATGRIRAGGARSRATWPATCATRACSRWRNASRR